MVELIPSMITSLDRCGGRGDGRPGAGAEDREVVNRC
jgi:hypothetical protein